jgi:hypothetical protein
VPVIDLGGNHFYDDGTKYARLLTPEIRLHCESEACSGLRLFSSNAKLTLERNVLRDVFVNYVCKNCTSDSKSFALMVMVEVVCPA